METDLVKMHGCPCPATVLQTQKVHFKNFGITTTLQCPMVVFSKLTFSYIANREAIYVQYRFWKKWTTIKQKWQYLGIGKEIRFCIWVEDRVVLPDLLANIKALTTSSYVMKL